MSSDLVNLITCTVIDCSQLVHSDYRNDLIDFHIHSSITVFMTQQLYSLISHGFLVGRRKCKCRNGVRVG